MEDGSECSALTVHSNSCSLTPAEIGEKDALAAVRMIVSLLSIMGASAIIASIIKNKQTWSPTLHPILQLSVADWALGVLWVVGAGVWFRGSSHFNWCFGISLLTVILECVTANLTLVYSIQAYCMLKKKNTTSALDAVHSPSNQIWHPCTSAVVYLTAWFLPATIVVVVFGSLVGTTRLVTDAETCSCWCFPHLGNVLPFSLGRDMPSATYVWHVRKLLVAYSSLLFINFLVVFVVMAITYYKTLREIRSIKIKISKVSDDNIVNYSISGTQAKARKRITHFLTVFLVITVSMLILCILILYYEGRALRKGPTINQGMLSLPASEYRFYQFMHVFQSATVPLQGFLNAIVYGRTREDFVTMIGTTGEFVARSDVDKAEIHVISQYDSDTELGEDSLLRSPSLSRSPSLESSAQT